MIVFASRTGFKGFFVRLDKAKPFDLVQHDYPFFVLRAFGFPQPILYRLLELYAALSSALTVNASFFLAFSVTGLVP